jgi:cytochrome c oxidase assembly protein subunit 15
MPARPTISPGTYERVAAVALGALTLIVLTGAAVRLTGSGLGCPDWPKCYGQAIAPLKTHAIIEYTNRLISGLVGLTAVAAGGLAFLRRPFRRDLAIIGVLLPLGVVGQAVLGGFTVRNHLEPGFVMAHFALSMLILVAAVALAWRAAHEPRARPPAGDRRTVWAVRALVPFGAVTILAGTVATAAGPHAGGFGSQRNQRLDFKGSGTLDWAISQHARIATAFGLLALGVFVLAWRRGGDAQLRRALGALVGLLAAQGAVGAIQYAFELPAEIVWLHVGLASLTWLALLWAAAAAGRPDAEPALAPGRGQVPVERAV